MLKFLLQKLNYVWRLVVMMVFFIGFALIAFLLGQVLMPVSQLFSKDKDQEARKIQYAISKLFRMMIFLLEVLGLANFKFNNFDKLKQDKGCLLLANHPTLIDSVAILAYLPRCNNIVKQSLWQNIFLKGAINKAGYIPNAQLFKIFAAIKKTVSMGDNLLMYPEGTRSALNKPLLLKRSAAQIALRVKMPIRLIHITCIPPVLTKEKKWYKIPATKPQFIFTVGERLEVEDFFQEGQQFSEAVQQLTADLQNKLQRGLTHV